MHACMYFQASCFNSNVSMGKISLNHHNENEGLQRVMQCNFMLPIVAQIGFGK